MARDAFFACYLLTPVATPQRLRCTYVGFTVSPTRRIRQHNGELVNGAKRTRKHRPWEMIVVVHGFPSKFHALQFEYAWQHPYNCRFTKERLRELQGSKGLGHPRSVKRKLVELHEMLHVSPWLSFPLTVSYTNLTIQNLVRTTKFFQWPTHMTCEVRPLHEFAELQRETGSTSGVGSSLAVHESGTCEATSGASGACYVCDEELAASELQVLTCYHEDCLVQCHSLCLADHFLLEASMASDANEPVLLRPERGSCPDCSRQLLWPLLVRSAKPTASASAKQKEMMASRNSKKRPRAADAKRSSAPRTGKRSGRVMAAGSDIEVADDHAGQDAEYDSASDGCSSHGWFEGDDEDDLARCEYVDRYDGATDACDAAVESSTAPLTVIQVRGAQSKRTPQQVDLVDLTMEDDD